MSAHSRTADAARPGDGLIRAGVGAFLVGLVFLLAAVVPFFFGRSDLPLWLELAALLVPAGMGVALVGLWRQARAARRRLRELDAAEDAAQ